mmetsp:Transcript_9700/g.24455  ORF Transcript_9700/g.24455 Transcript_9700/m.24455 type:complete len:232 (-) Transcript_9700:1531-2226(-)
MAAGPAHWTSACLLEGPRSSSPSTIDAIASEPISETASSIFACVFRVTTTTSKAPDETAMSARARASKSGPTQMAASAEQPSRCTSSSSMCSLSALMIELNAPILTAVSRAGPSDAKSARQMREIASQPHACARACLKFLRMASRICAMVSPCKMGEPRCVQCTPSPIVTRSTVPRSTRHRTTSSGFKSAPSFEGAHASVEVLSRGGVKVGRRSIAAHKSTDSQAAQSCAK